MTARMKGASGFGEKLFQAYRVGQVSQAELMARIAGRKNAVDTANRAVIEIDACRDREFAAAEVRADGNGALVAKLKMPTRQWHVRARTVLSVIAAGRWADVSGAGSYAAMYSQAAAIVRPKRRRKGARPIGARKVASVQRVIGRADRDEAVALLVALVDRLNELKVDYAEALAKDTRRLAHLPRPNGNRVRLIPLYKSHLERQQQELQKAA